MINLTDREREYLSSDRFNTRNIIADKRLLNKLEKLGYIKLHAHTGQEVYWYGSYYKAWYIDEMINRNLIIKDLGIFMEVYVSGSFNPYLMFKKFNND